MKTARFDPAGGAIVAEVTPEPKRDGAYELKLWEANENKVIERWHGNFINTADDAHDLPQPNDANHDRIVELVATVAVPPGVGPCTVSLIIRQDGRELARDQGIVAPNTAAGLVNVFIKLEKGA
jgi:hypothetical protein